jgi:ribosomal protein S12 methylthiotransferase
VDNLILVDAKDNYVRIGDFAEVKITGAKEYDLIGKVITNGK